MTRRIHHTTIGGKTFTFPEWAEWLKAHPDSTAFPFDTFEGFAFNVHGHCLNPNVLLIGDQKYPNPYILLRTYRRPKGEGGPIVWYYDVYGMRCGASGFGPCDGDEKDAILLGLAACHLSLTLRIAWYNRWIETGNVENMGYEAERAKNKKILAQVDAEFDKQREPTLF